MKKFKTEHQIKQHLLKDQAFCIECCSVTNLTLSHIISKSQEPKHKYNADNCCIMCIDCHKIWEHKNWSEKVFMVSFDYLIEKMRNVDNKYYMKVFHLDMPEKVKFHLVNKGLEPWK